MPVNDENANIVSNLPENQKVKKAVAKIQKNKVNFIPSSNHVVTSQTMKFEQGSFSKMSLAQAKQEKFESIINSAALRGLIMNPVLTKQQSE